MFKVRNLKSNIMQDCSGLQVAKKCQVPLATPRFIKRFKDADNAYVYKNISYEEYQKIVRNDFEKTCIDVTKIALGGIALSTAAFLLFKSGKFDKQINNFCNLIHLHTKKKISNILDFTKARNHFNNIGVNGLKQISGAHEVRECIQTLLDEGGSIINIIPSKTQNGLFDITYEINNIVSDVPKTVYIAEELSAIDQTNLFNLTKKYRNKNLLKSLNKMINNAVFSDTSSFMQKTEDALKDGFIIKTPGMKAAVLDAKRRISSLTAQHTSKSKQLPQLEDACKKAKDELKLVKNTYGPSSDEFQQKLSELSKAKEQLRKLKNELSSIQNRINNTMQHYKLISNSVNIFAENDGKLFGAFAHYENGKLLVDSYFPITHGSKLQNDFVKYCLDAQTLAISDIKCLIGAKKSAINDYFLNLGKNLKNWCVDKQVVPKGAVGLFTYSGIKSDIKARKLSKKREKINANFDKIS